MVGEVSPTQVIWKSGLLGSEAQPGCQQRRSNAIQFKGGSCSVHIAWPGSVKNVVSCLLRVVLNRPHRLHRLCGLLGPPSLRIWTNMEGPEPLLGRQGQRGPGQSHGGGRGSLKGRGAVAPLLPFNARLLSSKRVCKPQVEACWRQSGCQMGIWSLQPCKRKQGPEPHQSRY